MDKLNDIKFLNCRQWLAKAGVVVITFFLFCSPKWPNNKQYYSIDCLIGGGLCLNGPAPIADWIDKINAAAGTWNYIAEIQLEYASSCKCVVQNSADGINAVIMGPLPGSSSEDAINYGAQAVTTVDPNNNLIKDVDIVFNMDKKNDFLNGTLSVQAVALHEFGHFLGIEHLTNTSAVMHKLYHGYTSLHTDDMNALKALYPATSPEGPATGEPASGCLMGTILMRHPFKLHLLSSLRVFRDNILAKSTKGNYFMDVYKKNWAKILTIIVMNPSLTRKISRLLTKYAPFLAMKDRSSLGQVEVTHDDIVQMRSMLDLFIVESDGDLQDACKIIKQNLTIQEGNSLSNVVESVLR